MLQLLSKVDIIDNSGGTRGRIIKILNKKKYGKVGGLVLLSVTKSSQFSSPTWPVATAA